MIVAIMQPYFLPYIGYFQLMAASDVFVVYDRIKYTKKGWINRNRFLLNSADEVFTLPLERGSDSLMISERSIAMDFKGERLLNKFTGAYKKAPYFKSTISVLEEILSSRESNLFNFIHNSILIIREYLGLKCEIIVSSSIPHDETLRSSDKVVALCRAVGAETYINPIGGVDLYDRGEFARAGVELKFHKALPFEYPQFGNDFIPWLSIVDVLMFNPLERVQEAVLKNFEFV